MELCDSLSKPKRKNGTTLHKISISCSLLLHTCDSYLTCLCVMLASLRKGSPFIHTKVFKPHCREPSSTTMQNWSHLLALAPGEFVFSRHFASYFFSISSLFGISFPLKKLVSKSDKIAHLTQNWTHRTSNQQNWSILHPARRLHSHLDSLRSTTIQPCTRFAGIPEASSLSAFS